MPDLAEGTEFAGCRIEGVVGRGGMGVVYRATQLRLGRPVALKLLAADRAADPEFRARFQREWRMAAAIDHPNVVPVYEAGEEDGRLYLVLRFVRGTDLHRLLRAKGPLAPERAAAVVAQVAAGLDAAHAAGLVHRDVKPANVLLDGDHVYLTDFGLTRLAASDTELTETGRWMGTVDYASPEQLHGERCDARADVYALGCVLYAALTGGPPYPRETVPAAFHAHLHDPPPRPSRTPGVPPEIDRVVARALAKRPPGRYPSAGDLGRAALAAARGEPVTEAERSVARGPAAPAGRPALLDDVPDADGAGSPPTEATRVNGHGPVTAATALPPASAPPPPPAGAARVHGRRSRGPKVLLALLAIAALAGVAVGVAVEALDAGGEPPATGPVSRAEVRDVVDRFARAYEREDPAALGRTLTRNVERVLPGGRQRGRAPVVAEYRRQFAANRVETYELEDLDASGGDVGRAKARYVVTRRGAGPFGGSIVFGVVRDGGRARIDLIAARPE